MSDLWSDVMAHPWGDFARVVSRPGQVRAELAGHAVWTTAVPTDIVRWIRGAVSPAGEVVAIGQGGDDYAWLVSGSGATRLEKTATQDPVAIRHDGRGFVVYIVTGPTTLTVNGVPRPIKHTSQGIREVLADGTVHLGDDYLVPAPYDGYTFWRRTVKAGFVVGQVGHGIGVLVEGEHHFFTAARVRMAEAVHFAVQPNRLAVCALTERGAWFQVFARPFPPHEPRIIAPAPTKPPDPTPEPPMTKFPTKLKNGETLRDFLARELGATGLLGRGSNEQVRRNHAAMAVAIVAAKANAIEGRQVFGVRSKHRKSWALLPLKAGGEIGVYSDCLAYREPFLSVDAVGSGESKSAKPGWSHEGPVPAKDVKRQRFVAPSELALEGVGDPPDEDDDGGGLPGTDPSLAVVLAELRALRARVDALEQPGEVALRAKFSGLYVRDSLDAGPSVLTADRKAVGDGETFILERRR